MARVKRATESYLFSALQLNNIIPVLKKFRHRKTLKPWEKAWIARKENIMRFADHLIPVTKQQAKQLKPLLYMPETMTKTGKRMRHHGIQAVQLRNVGLDVSIKRVKGENIFVVSNGRTWVYWAVPDVSPQAMKEAAEDAFDDPQTFEIERVIELARQAFERPETKAVYLWAEKGRVGEAMTSLREFVRWIGEDYRRYENTERWVRGIAILIGEVGERVTLKEFASFSPRREPKERIYKPRKKKRSRR